MGIGTLRRHRDRLLATAVALAVADSGHTPLVQVPASPDPNHLVPQDKKLPNNFTARGILAAAGIETYKQLVAFADDDLAQLSGLDQEKLQKVREARDKFKATLEPEKPAEDASEPQKSESAEQPELEPSGLQETPELQKSEPAQTPEPSTTQDQQ